MGCIKLLGLPLGRSAAQSSELLQKHQDSSDSRSLAAALAAIRELARLGGAYAPSAALALLRTCAVHKVGYALRLLPPADTAPLARWADAEVRAAFAAIVGFDACDAEWLDAAGGWRWDRIALPARLGGCGLPSAVRTAAMAYVGAFFACAPHLVERDKGYAQSGTPAGTFTALVAPAYVAAAAASLPAPAGGIAGGGGTTGTAAGGGAGDSGAGAGGSGGGGGSSGSGGSFLLSPAAARFQPGSLRDYGYEGDENDAVNSSSLLDRSAVAMSKLSGMSLDALNQRIERILAGAQ